MIADKPIIVDPEMTADDWRSIRHWLEPRIYNPEDDEDDDEDEDFDDLVDFGGEG